MEHLPYFGDDALENLVIRMDQLTEFKLKFGAVQYMEDLRNEVLSGSMYKAVEAAEKQQELKTDVRKRILQRIQGEILKRILPTDRNAHFAVKLMNSLNQQNGDAMEDFNGEFEEENRNIRKENSHENVEKTQPEPIEDNTKRIIRNVQVELLRDMLPADRTSKMALQFMKLIQGNYLKLKTVHQELLNKLEQRDINTFEESLRTLEEVNRTKWKATLESWNKLNKARILNAILVGLVRKIRIRSCPQMAAKIMKKLQDHNLILHRLQQELVLKVKERENIQHKKQIVEKELMIKVKMLEEIKEQRKRIHMEFMNYHLEKNDRDEGFVPRKLFLNGVDTFKFLPKLETRSKIENEKIEGKVEPFISQTNEHTPLSPDIKRDATKPNRSIKNRLKRFFAMK